MTALKLLRAVPAVAVVALFVIPIATAVAVGRSHPSAKRALSVGSQLAPLKKEIKQLQSRISVLERSKTSNSSRGPAGGDLTGPGPNPKLGAGVVSGTSLAPVSVGTATLIDRAVTGAMLALGAVTSDKIAGGAIGPAALGADSVDRGALARRAVGGLALNDAFPVIGGSVGVAPGETQQASATCPEGTRVLSGGFEWESRGNGASVISSSPTFTGNPDVTWTVRGRVDTGGQANSLLAEVLCING